MTMKTPAALWSAVMAFVRKHALNEDADEVLGTIWKPPLKDTSDIRSKTGGGRPLSVAFRNTSEESLLLCWMDSKNKPHHFYILDPYTETDIRDWTLRETDHVEQTVTGDTFLWASCEDVKAAREKKSLEDAAVLGAYRPEHDHPPRSTRTRDDEKPLHIVTILPPPKGETEDDSALDCTPCGPLRRCSPRLRRKQQEEQQPVWSCRIHYIAERKVDRSHWMDTTEKCHYRKTELAGWPIYQQDPWPSSADKFLQRFASDLKAAQACLPPAACEILREKAPVWINASFCFGPRKRPFHKKGGCFHPDVKWLLKNKMHRDKAGCVEFYDADAYLKSRDNWGPGGLIVHELSHAYHHHCLQKGHSNPDVIQCYKDAMKKGLYDSVRVHGPQGPTAKAYATENAMEYFAELSAAFLGGTNDYVNDEFNKWYPFNRKQILEHDPAAHAMLERLWKVHEKD